MQDLVNGDNLEQPEQPAIEMPQEQIKTNMTRRNSKKDRSVPPLSDKQPDVISSFSKEIIGKLVTFYGKTESGIEQIEGVPMLLMQDPNYRWLVKFYSSDNARAFFYLDQASTFYVRDGNTPVNNSIRQPGETEEVSQASPGNYYVPLSNEPLPEMVPNRRSGLRNPQNNPGSVKRVPRQDTQQ